MTQANEVEPLTTIIHPKTGRFVDVVKVDEASDGTVTITSLEGRSIRLDAATPVYVLQETQIEFRWIWAAILGAYLALTGLVLFVVHLFA